MKKLLVAFTALILILTAGCDKLTTSNVSASGGAEDGEYAYTYYSSDKDSSIKKSEFNLVIEKDTLTFKERYESIYKNEVAVAFTVFSYSGAYTLDKDNNIVFDAVLSVKTMEFEGTEEGVKVLKKDIEDHGVTDREEIPIDTKMTMRIDKESKKVYVLRMESNDEEGKFSENYKYRKDGSLEEITAYYNSKVYYTEKYDKGNNLIDEDTTCTLHENGRIKTKTVEKNGKSEITEYDENGRCASYTLKTDDGVHRSTWTEKYEYNVNGAFKKITAVYGNNNIEQVYETYIFEANGRTYGITINDYGDHVSVTKAFNFMGYNKMNAIGISGASFKKVESIDKESVKVTLQGSERAAYVIYRHDIDEVLYYLSDGTLIKRDKYVFVENEETNKIDYHIESTEY